MEKKRGEYCGINTKTEQWDLLFQLLSDASEEGCKELIISHLKGNCGFVDLTFTSFCMLMIHTYQKFPANYLVEHVSHVPAVTTPMYPGKK